MQTLWGQKSACEENLAPRLEDQEGFCGLQGAPPARVQARPLRNVPSVRSSILPLGGVPKWKYQDLSIRPIPAMFVLSIPLLYLGQLLTPNPTLSRCLNIPLLLRHVSRRRSVGKYQLTPPLCTPPQSPLSPTPYTYI